jgi:hypothetical protein
METLIIAVIAGIGFILAYHTYGNGLAKLFSVYPQLQCAPQQSYETISISSRLLAPSFLDTISLQSLGQPLILLADSNGMLFKKLRVRQIFR